MRRQPAGLFRSRRTKALQPPAIPWTSTETGRPRALLECPPDMSPSIVSRVLEREGLDVIVCQGPNSREQCPATHGDYCAPMQAVDAVVNMLGTRRPEQAAVLPSVAATGPRPPAILAVVGPDHPDTAGVQTVGYRATGSEIVAAVHQALAGRDRALPSWDA